ncbi:uncharacterized protein RAG0_02709 [Rhynchosporium agropyri]|uniref:Uncharacterized protein n=1 Tax=Rhynchosporium agropyri TaxID=914238 RepID=A0A1E1K2M1_9HELO|nr:uncharacterized protein RAG0_02709 [Rhynchosporium agropyri]
MYTICTYPHAPGKSQEKEPVSVPLPPSAEVHPPIFNACLPSSRLELVESVPRGLKDSSASYEETSIFIAILSSFHRIKS